MSERPRVTIAVPTYNRADRWLGDAISSALAQTYTDLQVIVGDNASEDDTETLVRSVRDSRLIYTRAQRNLGPIPNFNRLIDMADTEFVLILADDDLLYPGYLEAAVGLMDQFETAGLVHTASELIDSQSRVIRTVDPLRGHSPFVLERRDRALERLMTSHWPMSFSTVMYRKEALVGGGGFPENEAPFNDLYLWMRIALGWDLGYIRRPLGALRAHPGTLTAQVDTHANPVGATTDPRIIHGGERFKRRMRFLENAPLAAETKAWHSALACMALLCEQADAGPAWPDLMVRVGRLTRTNPRLVTRRVFWLVVLRVEPLRQRIVRLSRRTIKRGSGRQRLIE